MRIEKPEFEATQGVSWRLWTGAAVIALFSLVAACGSPSPVTSSDDGHVDLIVGSSEPDGGSLVMDYDFGLPFEVFESTTVGAFTLWSGTDPGFAQAEVDEPSEGVYALADGVTVSLEVTALEAGTQFRFGDQTVDEVGESVVLGTVPELHGHGEWQVALPEGVSDGDYAFSFRFIAEGGEYGPSEPETAFLTPTSGDEHDHDDEHGDDDHDDGDEHGDDDHDDGDEHGDDDHDDGDEHDDDDHDDGDHDDGDEHGDDDHDDDHDDGDEHGDDDHDDA